jgi:hypothetical protein
MGEFSWKERKMSRAVKAPDSLDHVEAARSLFLAGSIEMGAAKDWQTAVTDTFQNDDLIILNPRRDEWDSSWVQSIDDPQFREQVEWELAAMEMATMIAVYFEPNSKSPITLLELGLFARSGKVVVCCPREFWRRGNVEIVCSRYHVPLVDTLEELTAEIRARLLQ